MKYTFRDFTRHIELFGAVRSLTKAKTDPESDAVTDLTTLDPFKAKNYRIMHMLTADGCTREQVSFYGPRFFCMHTFLDHHSDEFSKASFIVIGDGTKSVAPMKLFRAVHETFRGDPMPDFKSVTVDAVSALANSYPAEWKPSECAS